MYSLSAEEVVENPAPSQPSSLANTISREAKGLRSSALPPSPAVSPQTSLPWARAPVISNQEMPPRQQCLTHLHAVTPQCHHEIAFAVQKATGPYSQRTEGGLRTDRWILLHRPCLRSPRVVTHGKFTDNIFSLNGTIYTGVVCIKG